MIVCSVNFGNQMDSSSSRYSPSSGYESDIRERRCPRVGTGFEFPPIVLEDLVVSVYFNGDASYYKMKESLTEHLKRTPSHGEVFLWLEECSRACTHGFLYLFKRDNAALMAEDLETSHYEIH